MAKQGICAKVITRFAAVSPAAAAGFALIVGGVITLASAHAAHRLYHQQLSQRFELLANERYSRIRERFEDQAQRLDGLRRFFLYSNEVSQAEFLGYIAPLLGRTQAYSWAPRVSGVEREAFETDASLLLDQPLRVRDCDSNGGWQTAPVRDVYYPVLYSEGLHHQGQPPGFDLAAHPLRGDALKRAGRPGSMAISAPVTMIDVGPDATRGLLLVAPVFSQPPGPQPQGYVTALLSVQQLIAEPHADTALDHLTVRITDLSDGDAHELLYQTGDDAAPLDLESQYVLTLADHSYQLQIRPNQAFYLANRASPAQTVGWVGGALTALLSALLYSLIGQRQRAWSLVHQRTLELRASEQSLRETHYRLRSVLAAATQVAIIATDLRGVISTFNAGAERLLGYAAEEALGRLHLERLVHGPDLQAHAERLSQRLGRPVSASQALFADTALPEGEEPDEWTLLRKDGRRLLANMLVTAVHDEQGLWVGYLAICIDVTERRRAFEALAARDRLLDKLSAQVPGGFYQYRLEADGRSYFSYASIGLGEVYELELPSLRRDAACAFERIHPNDRQRVRQSVLTSAAQLSPWREEYRVQLPRAGLRWVRGEATPEAGEGGSVVWHGYLSDITDLKRVEEELRTLSITDALTGIHNRRYFQQRLHTEVQRAARRGAALAVIMLDIDHFKRINDRHGHALGDQVLRSLCQRVLQRLRRSDVFCRLGGEEFVVLCPDTDQRQALALAEQLVQGLRRDPVAEVGFVTASFGVASWRAGESADALLRRADAGVYAAKQAGRDRVQPELP